MTRTECLDAAKTYICTDRNNQYGEPENNFSVIARLWEVYLREQIRKVAQPTERKGIVTICLEDVELLPQDVAAMMVLFKVAREATAKVSKADSWADLCGYGAIGCELTTEISNG